MDFETLTAIEDVQVLLSELLAVEELFLHEFAETADTNALLLSIRTRKQTYQNVAQLICDLTYKAQKDLTSAINAATPA